MTNCIMIRWPKRELSPNSRVHWTKRAKAAKSYRREAAIAALSVRGWMKAGEDLKMTITFCPPDRRRRDRDNLISSLKAAMDGIADSIGIDDSRFDPTYRMGEVVKGGAVMINIALDDMPLKP